MDGWTITTIQSDTCTLIIRRPQLTPEERAKRMKAIKKAAADLVLAQMKGKKKCD